MKSKTVKLIEDIILKDEFDDSLQNEEYYKGIAGQDLLIDAFSRYGRKSRLTLEIGCGGGDLFELIPDITCAIDPNPERIKTASKKSKKVKTMSDWAEEIPYPAELFDNVICWQTVCHLRSPMEAFIEVNRVLTPNGVFFFDVVLSSQMPIIQTVDRLSFLKYIRLFGFEILKQEQFGPEHNRHLALIVEKISTFKPENFRLPQCVGKINNYLEERDWYLK